jgi:hypothetical protein
VTLEQTARAETPTPRTARAAVLLVLNLYIDPDTNDTPRP